MFVIHFFDCNVSSKNLLSLFLQKFRRPVLFSCKLITFNSNWWTNSPRETAVDIKLDVWENSRGNVYSEVPSEVVAYQHGVYWSFQIKFFPGFSEQKNVSTGDLQE